MPESALSDLLVVDLSQGIAGPYCTKLLADYGAEVIKVEPPGTGDLSRRLGPFPSDVPHPEKSGLFLHLNTGKKSVTLDVSTASGTVILKKLLARADVLVESSQPGRMAEWGLGYEQLKDDFPKLVYASVTPFGQTGPYRDYQGNSITAMAMSGLMYVFLGAIRRRFYSRHVFTYPADIMPCRDGYVVVVPGAFGFPSPMTPDSASPMALMVGDLELDKDILFNSFFERSVRWRDFNALLEPWLLEHDTREIVELAQALRMAFAHVPTVGDLLGGPD